MYGDLKIKGNCMQIKNPVILFFFVLLVSCSNNQGKISSVTKPGLSEMADLNRYLVLKDRERIKNFIERKSLQMNETPTGLWYQIKKQGSGNAFGTNDKVVFNYECSLLDGTKCYSSADLGPKEVILGKSSIEQGLNEGLRLLKPGAEAIFIIPPYLAYGLIGDRKMIPSRAVIVYNVNILQVR